MSEYKFELYWNEIVEGYRCKVFKNNYWLGDLFVNADVDAEKWVFCNQNSSYMTAGTLRKVAKKLDELNEARKMRGRLRDERR